MFESKHVRMDQNEKKLEKPDIIQYCGVPPERDKKFVFTVFLT